MNELEGGCALLVQSPANVSDANCRVGQFFFAISQENTSPRLRVMSEYSAELAFGHAPEGRR